MDFFAGMMAAGAGWLIDKALWWIFHTDSRLDSLETDVKRLAERLDTTDKERWSGSDRYSRKVHHGSPSQRRPASVALADDR